MKIRHAKEADAQGILEAHRSAVHEIASRDYPQDILNEWAKPLTPDRTENYLKNSLPKETTLVAEVDGRIAGFGAIVESENELRAVYVSAQFARQGIGAALLNALETLAKKLGCPELHMDSSVTAERFYKTHGYEVLERGEHTLRSGRRMVCVKMRKSLV